MTESAGRPVEAKESVGYLLAQVCRLHGDFAGMVLERIGLYRGQPPVIISLHDEDGLTQGELAARLGVAPATMTRMLQRMEQSGFVQRRTDETDQRISRVYLTDTGRAIRGDLMSTLDVIRTNTFTGLDDAELDTLRGLLARLRANLQQAVAGQREE